jgi:RecB family exonuclease
LTPKVEMPEKKLRPVSEAAAKSRLAQPGLFDPIEPPSRVDSRIAEWAERYRPHVFSPLPLSASSIETYANCPQKYLFDKGWGIRGGPRAAMTFGAVMHTTIAWFLNAVKARRRPPWEEVEQVFDREWRSTGFQDDYQESEYRKDGLEQLRAFYEKFLAEPPEVLHVEKTFELALARDVKLTGRMDAVHGLGDGQVEVVDYKTGRPQTERSAKKNLQLSIYALAAKEVLELEPARLTLYSLATNEAVSATREEKDLEQARDKVAETAENIRAGHFPAQPQFVTCRGCDYRPICPAFEGTGL